MNQRLKLHLPGEMARGEVPTNGDPDLPGCLAAALPQIALIMIPAPLLNPASEVGAECWSQHVIFHDPFAERRGQDAQGHFPRKRERAPRRSKTNEKSGRQQLRRAEALEAVSRDLAVLALRAPTQPDAGAT